ncbi:MAG: hypothetical protein JSU63_17455 [Phycisphaerales bacterium]|nr:MAG: hypothetical protein JSU63_17455 [Phycisphaerales bacterium]
MEKRTSTAEEYDGPRGVVLVLEAEYAVYSLMGNFDFEALVLATILLYLIWRLARRYPAGHCRSCGYNLRGNTAPCCPRCGAKVKEP